MFEVQNGTSLVGGSVPKLLFTKQTRPDLVFAVFLSHRKSFLRSVVVSTKFQIVCGYNRIPVDPFRRSFIRSGPRSQIKTLNSFATFVSENIHV